MKLFYQLKSITLLCLTCLAFSYAHAQKSTYDLSGVILDEQTGEPLPHATLIVSGTNLGALSNTDGRFSILNIPNDEGQMLSINYLGYQEKVIPISSDLNLGRMMIELQSIGFEVDEVVISTGASNVMKSGGLSQISLNPARIQKLPSLGERDIFRTLQLMPGVSGTNESSSGLYVRGGTPDQNLVLFDGFTVYHVDHFFGFFSAFNANAVKDVQLYKGGFEAKYGGRLSSVVNLTGKQGNTKEFDLDAGLGLLSGNLSLEVPLWNKGSLIIAGRHSYPGLNNGIFNKIFDLFIEEPEVQSITTDPSFQFYDLNAKATFLPSEKDVIAISFYNGQDDLDNSRKFNIDRRRETQRGTVGVLVENDISDELAWGNWGLSGKWARTWNSRWYSNAVLAWSNYFSKRDLLANGTATIFRPDTTIERPIGNSFLEDNDVSDLTLRIDNEIKLNSSHTLELGTQLTAHDIAYQYIQNDTTEVLDRQDNGNLYAFYVQDKWKPLNGLELNLGVRASYFGPTEEWYIAPRASFTYDFLDGFKLKAAWGQYYQFTNRIVREDVLNGSRDFWVLADGEQVQIGEAMHYIAGISYENDKFLFDIEAYQKDLTGLSEFSLRFSNQRGQGRGGIETSASEFFYAGTGVARGIEFLAQKTSGAYTGWISYTLSEVVHDFPDLSDFPFYALHHQLHELKLVQSYELEDWTFSGAFVFSSGKPYTAPGGIYQLETINGDIYSYISVGAKNAEQLPHYHRLDLSVSRDFKIKTSTLQAGISIFNLYNRRNVWYKDFDVQGDELIENDFLLLGMTPNLFLNFSLK